MENGEAQEDGEDEALQNALGLEAAGGSLESEAHVRSRAGKKVYRAWSHAEIDAMLIGIESLDNKRALSHYHIDWGVVLHYMQLHGFSHHRTAYMVRKRFQHLHWTYKHFKCWSINKSRSRTSAQQHLSPPHGLHPDLFARMEAFFASTSLSDGVDLISQNQQYNCECIRIDHNVLDLDDDNGNPLNQSDLGDWPTATRVGCGISPTLKRKCKWANTHRKSLHLQQRKNKRRNCTKVSVQERKMHVKSSCSKDTDIAGVSYQKCCERDEGDIAAELTSTRNATGNERMGNDIKRVCRLKPTTTNAQFDNVRNCSGANGGLGEAEIHRERHPCHSQEDVEHEALQNALGLEAAGGFLEAEAHVSDAGNKVYRAWSHAEIDAMLIGIESLDNNRALSHYHIDWGVVLHHMQLHGFSYHRTAYMVRKRFQHLHWTYKHFKCWSINKSRSHASAQQHLSPPPSLHPDLFARMEAFFASTSLSDGVDLISQNQQYNCECIRIDHNVLNLDDDNGDALKKSDLNDCPTATRVGCGISPTLKLKYKWANMHNKSLHLQQRKNKRRANHTKVSVQERKMHVKSSCSKDVDIADVSYKKCCEGDEEDIAAGLTSMRNATSNE